MNDKKKFFVALCVCGVIALLFRGIATKPESHVQPKLESPNGVAANTSSDIKQMHVSSDVERMKMPQLSRIAFLEKLGYVPEHPGVNMTDYFLAEKTSWWGKRLAPKEFWKDKVVWYDKVSEFEANRRGRAWPPMPYEDPSVADRSDVDRKANGFHFDGSTPNYVSSEREKVFWINFIMAHPPPPERIQHWLSGEADSWLRIRNKVEHSKNTVFKARDLEDLLARTLRDASILYPQESITPEAFHWDHVMRKRAKYEELIASGDTEDSLSVRLFFNDVYVAHSLITEPLTEDQINAANAWKVAYLKRLRAEKWDESYINAYLDAWDLTEEYVFGEKGSEILSQQ